MLISVIIPVYQAEPYVRQAVESAMIQPETGEVILVEDASPDNSLEVCEALAQEHGSVRLLRHPDGKNHGAGASRNLGIQHARCDYVAFLDADDYYLPGRFSIARDLFHAQPHIDGVYEAIGTHFENTAAKQRWFAQRTSSLTTMHKRVAPERLFEAQAPIGDAGYCSIDGWTVKRSIFEKTGLFEPHLRLHQDTAMLVKFAAVGTMIPGRLDTPVAMRRLHDHNRITAARSAIQTYRNQLLLWQALWAWGKDRLESPRRDMLFQMLVGTAITPYERSRYPRMAFQAMRQFTQLLLAQPDLSLEGTAWIMYLVHLLRRVSKTWFLVPQQDLDTKR